MPCCFYPSWVLGTLKIRDSCLGLGILHPSFLGLGEGTDLLYAAIHSNCTLRAADCIDGHDCQGNAFCSVMPPACHARELDILHDPLCVWMKFGLQH